MQKPLVSLFAAALAAVAFPAAAAIATISQTQIVEFYNASLDHYFISADSKEIADLDNGVHAGWARTGFSFQALKAGATLTGSTPVCRFYGKPEAGLDSHFYTASPAECQAVQDRFAAQWQYESPEVFRAYPVDPNTGKCPSDTGPVYRLYNKRADVNHRYTDQTSIFQTMVAKGYVAEGDGNPQLPVAFCMPIGTSSTPASAPGTPSCTITASSTLPTVGSMLALTTVCTNSPTSYTWTGCASTTGACQAGATAPGGTTYTVTASNSVGAGAAASISVTWQGSAGPVPVCTISGTTATPAVGTSLGLIANCSQTPTRYEWVECNAMIQTACNLIPACSSTSATCTVTSSNPGIAHYGVQAANGAGAGARAGFDADWKSGGGVTTPSPTVPTCSVYASNAFPTVNNGVVLTASCSGSPTSYAWTGCASSGTTCSTTSATAGAKTFSVVASNATGNSAPASVTVTWQAQPVPSCSVSASKSAPMLGETVTLTANCSGSPTGYQWTGCTGTGAQCSAAETVAGAKTYGVVASNAAGPGPQANATVNWQAPPTSPPVCTISASNASPFTGTAITLTASCNNSPTSYAWTGCSSSSATCVATSNTAGAATYGVSASNVVGNGAAASTTVNWQQSTAPPDFCSAYNDVVRIGTAWGSGPTYPTDYGGTFRANEVLVIGVTVPAAAANKLFSASVTEYGGSPTFRDMRLSRSPCDFSRSVDPTGANGPISAGYNGQTVSVSGTVGVNMQPGQTYYISIRNWSALTGLTCQTSTCNILVGYQWPL